MTTISPEAHARPEVLLSARYTVEELAVIADLYEIASLPGVPPIEMSAELRSLATRTLVARGIVRMPPTGGVEITQPHATLIASMFDAPTVVQASEVRGATVRAWSWFELVGHAVCVSAPDEGVVTISAHKGDAMANIHAQLGITSVAPSPPGTPVDAVLETSTITREGTTTTVVHGVLVHTLAGWAQAGASPI